MKKLFYLLIATIVLISCGNGSKNKTETSIAKENQTLIPQHFDLTLFISS